MTRAGAKLTQARVVLRRSSPAPFTPYRSAHAFESSYGFAWFCPQHAALVTQTVVTLAHTPGGVVLSDWIDRTFAFERTAIHRLGGLFIFHDMRSLEGYDPKCRILINERIRQGERGYARRTIIVAEPTPLWRMALQITDLTFALLGVKPATVTADMKRALLELEAITPGPTPAWLKATGDERRPSGSLP